MRPQVKPDPSTGHAWCAWNIEVGYDRKAYYEKVMPVLEWAIDPLSDQKLPGFTVKAPSVVPLNMPSQDPDYNMRRTAVTGIPLRFPSPAGRDFTFPKIDNSTEIVVCLNDSADKTRQSLRFHSWKLSSSLYRKWLEERYSTPHAIKIEFLDENHDVVVDQVLQLWNTLVTPTNYDMGKARGVMEAAGSSPEGLRETQLAHWGATEDWSNAAVLWLTPDFFTKWPLGLAGNFVHSPAYADSLLIHLEMSMDPDDIKRIKSNCKSPACPDKWTRRFPNYISARRMIFDD